MNKGYWFIWLFCLMVLSNYGCHRRHLIEKEPLIRVLLTHASHKPCRIEAGKGCTIFDSDHKLLFKSSKALALKISSQQGGICINGRGYPHRQIEFAPLTTGIIKVNAIGYRGGIVCKVVANGKLLVTNVLPLEEYLLGVVGAEMPLSWPAAALQAQAIIARTYALYQKLNGRQRHFDVYDTTASQVYQGTTHENKQARAIIQSTRGMVLFYQNSIFKAFFHSTCGGHTANARQVFAYADISPLGGRQCPYCRASPYYQWEYRADIARLHRLMLDLKLKLPFVGMAIHKQDRHGRVLTIQIYFGKGRRTTIPASIIRRHLGNSKIRSTLFTIAPAENGILFCGKGWGHGVGLCQFGAKIMAAKGCNALEILQFYYPGAGIYRLWH